MTTREFIEKALLQTTSKNSCSSVVAYKDIDGQVTVYSYGTHYPLVTILEGKAFVNDRGYSVTTGKHIGWAFSAAANIVGYDNVYHAPLSNGGSLCKKDIILGCTSEYNRLRNLMSKKKRKDTKVYAWLQTLQDRVSTTLDVVQQLS